MWLKKRDKEGYVAFSLNPHWEIYKEGRRHSMEGGRKWLMHRKPCSQFFRKTVNTPHIVPHIVYFIVSVNKESSHELSESWSISLNGGVMKMSNLKVKYVKYLSNLICRGTWHSTFSAFLLMDQPKPPKNNTHCMLTAWKLDQVIFMVHWVKTDTRAFVNLSPLSLALTVGNCSTRLWQAPRWSATPFHEKNSLNLMFSRSSITTFRCRHHPMPIW